MSTDTERWIARVVNDLRVAHPGLLVTTQTHGVVTSDLVTLYLQASPSGEPRPTIRCKAQQEMSVLQALAFQAVLSAFCAAAQNLVEQGP